MIYDTSLAHVVRYFGDNIDTDKNKWCSFNQLTDQYRYPVRLSQQETRIAFIEHVDKSPPKYQLPDPKSMAKPLRART